MTVVTLTWWFPELSLEVLLIYTPVEKKKNNVFIQVLRLYIMKRERNYFISCWIFKFANLQKNIETLGCLWIINKLLSYSFRLIHHLFQDHPYPMKQDYFITLCNVFFLLYFSFSSFCLSLLKWNYPKNERLFICL